MADVVPKCGTVVTWHWSHTPRAPCSDLWGGESEWHHAWKEWALRIGWAVETTIEKRGERHRADILTPKGWVVELQHSSLDARAIAERETFYGRVIWVFDMAGKEERFTFNEREGWTGFRWRQGIRSLAGIRRPLYLDFGAWGLLQASVAIKPHPTRDHNMVIGRGRWKDRGDFVRAFA